jgi:hypothetical protein
MRARRFLLFVALAGAAAWGCSLLATSRDEATSGLDDEAGSGKRDGSGGDGGEESDGACKRVVCGLACCGACTQDICAGCQQNGGPCVNDQGCCTGNCISNKCGASASTCLAENATCTSAQNCCANLTCRPNPNATDGGDAGAKLCMKCATNGTKCTAGSECCTGRCVDGGCAECLAKDAKCGSDVDCCSGDCDHPKNFCH